MFGFERPHVVVAGAGPVGQVAALTLSDRSVPVSIFDEAAHATPNTYALALHPGSLRLLEQIGLGPAVAKRALMLPRISFFEDDQALGHVDLDELGLRPGAIAVLRQDDLEEILEEALNANKTKIRWNHRIARFSEGEEAVDVFVEKMIDAPMGYGVAHMERLVSTRKQVHAPFVIAADGHKSLLRRQLHIPFEQTSAPELFAVFEFTTDHQPENELRIFFSGDSTNVLWPLADGRCRFSFQLSELNVQPGPRTKEQILCHLGPEGFPVLTEDSLQQLLGQRAPWFDGSIEDIEWRIVVRFDHRLADSFGSGHIWLAGDAAHMTGPVGVQSMNIGLREAFHLAQIVADGVQGSEVDFRLAGYNRSRLAEWRRLLQGQPKAVNGAADWVARHADRIVPCLPASGADLDLICRHLGLEIEMLAASEDAH